MQGGIGQRRHHRQYLQGRYGGQPLGAEHQQHQILGGECQADIAGSQQETGQAAHGTEQRAQACRLFGAPGKRRQRIAGQPVVERGARQLDDA
ncbi:hypothetical protein D3C77_460700 [compost metagenome]